MLSEIQSSTFRRKKMMFQGDLQARVFKVKEGERKVGSNPITSLATRSENVRLYCPKRHSPTTKWKLRKSNEMEAPTENQIKSSVCAVSSFCRSYATQLVSQIADERNE
ncbi:hypothetical protein TNIN_396001 [Trichonephila inaurata madagascariensis]|uniref:Uncharacterized protein n=1 Tax=Trichonephila inaurata madagascariensis TaxID=2747483 RepID=A0A8X6XYD5_9ARAC|nr:hypothetical protein TNIN_396001 [Trichonephila inaurata madagascariensis]